MSIKALNNAIAGKKDEFYTQYEDIEKEVLRGGYDLKQFEDKVILCNCDDPFESSFTRFFLVNFKYLKIKRLICTCYKGSPIAIGGLFKRITPQNNGYVLDINGLDLPEEGLTQDKILDYIKKNNLVKNLKGDGDFRSEECLAYLKEADIVITNPPFSLWRDFLNTLIEYYKKFIIWGNPLACKYIKVFELIKANKLWFGGSCGATGYFRLPESYEKWDEEYTEKKNDDKKYGHVMFSTYTNLNINKRNEKLILYKTYKGNEQYYLKYENYDAINIDKVADIPKDYEGVMGVPYTFLYNFNPNQFKILGCRYGDDGKDLRISGKSLFVRFLIQRIDKEDT